MEVKYTICDICGTKVEASEQIDSIAKISILKYNKAKDSKEITLTETPFTIENISDVSPTERLEKITIDLCNKCSDVIEKKCLSLREKNEEKQENKSNI